MNLAALIQQPSITVADCFRHDIKHFGNFVVAHLKSVSQTEKIFFGVGQSAEDIEQLPVLDVVQAVRVVEIIFVGAAYQLDAFIDFTFAIDVSFLPIIGNRISGNGVNPRR